jgi:hypothetical protein
VADRIPTARSLTNAICFSLYSGAFWAQATEGAAWAVYAHHSTGLGGFSHG